MEPDALRHLDVTAGGTITDDSLSYDIFSQAGQAIRSRPELLGGLPPLMLLAVGASQSASRLTPYYNSVQPLHSVYDGFLLHVGGGPFRTDVAASSCASTPRMKSSWGQAAVRQPDTRTFRSWEIAGESTLAISFRCIGQQLVARDGLAPFNSRAIRPPLSHVYNELRDERWLRAPRRLGPGRQAAADCPTDPGHVSRRRR